MSAPAAHPLVDSHTHLHLLAHQDADSAVADARAAGVGTLLNVAVDLASRDVLLEICARHRGVVTALGVHPSAEVPEPTVAEVVAAADHPAVVAVGETGLDYFHNRGDLEWQRQRFRTHLRAAREIGKPVIIHTRDAPRDTVRILREERAWEVGGVIHCFTEGPEAAKAFLDLGFAISLSGIVTFRQAEALRETVRGIPLERLMVETDAPYLAPVPHRGKPNRPAWVTLVAEAVAWLKDVDLSTFAEVSARTFVATFPLAAGRMAL